MSNIVSQAERLALRGKLRKHFGFQRFRSGQVEAVASAIQAIRYSGGHARRIGKKSLLPAPRA
ncbi:hypothetical protein, partial [Tautonia rosea]|uniref:hypothetical protein n=1 Tax=Tautonia rosea TaxID=2728037 RepID=UPI0019D0EBC5